MNKEVPENPKAWAKTSLNQKESDSNTIYHLYSHFLFPSNPSSTLGWNTIWGSSQEKRKDEGHGEKNIKSIWKGKHQNPMKQTKFHKNNYITYIHHSSVCILKVPLKDLFCNRILKNEII